MDDDLKADCGLKSAIMPISKLTRRQNADALKAINRSIINTSAISETIAASAGISSIIGQMAIPSEQISAMLAAVQPSLTARTALTEALADAVRPSLTARAVLAEAITEALRPSLVNAAALQAITEAMRPSQEMTESLAALSSQIVGLSATSAQASMLGSLGQAFTASSRLGHLSADYASFAEAAVIAEPALVEVDPEVADAWIFAGWYSGQSRRRREILLGALIALMVPLFAVMNTCVSEQQRVPEGVIQSYVALAVVFGAACAYRDADDG